MKRTVPLKRAHMTVKGTGSPRQNVTATKGGAVPDRTRKGTEAKRTAAKARKEQVYRSKLKKRLFEERECCQLCDGERWRECLTDDHMHEDPPRSATRGRPMEERFNERVCGRVCWACHRDVTEGYLTVEFEDEVLRFAGPVSATYRVRP